MLPLSADRVKYYRQRIVFTGAALVASIAGGVAGLVDYSSRNYNDNIAQQAQERLVSTLRQNLFTSNTLVCLDATQPADTRFCENVSVRQPSDPLFFSYSQEQEKLRVIMAQRAQKKDFRDTIDSVLEILGIIGGIGSVVAWSRYRALRDEERKTKQSASD